MGRGCGCEECEEILGYIYIYIILTALGTGKRSNRNASWRSPDPSEAGFRWISFLEPDRTSIWDRQPPKHLVFPYQGGHGIGF